MPGRGEHPDDPGGELRRAGPRRRRRTRVQHHVRRVRRVRLAAGGTASGRSRSDGFVAGGQGEAGGGGQGQRPFRLGQPVTGTRCRTSSRRARVVVADPADPGHPGQAQQQRQRQRRLVERGEDRPPRPRPPRQPPHQPADVAADPPGPGPGRSTPGATRRSRPPRAAAPPPPGRAARTAAPPARRAPPPPGCPARSPARPPPSRRAPPAPCPPERGAAGTTAACRRRISATAAGNVDAVCGAAATSSPRVTGVGTRIPDAPAARAAVMSRPMSPTTTHRPGTVSRSAAAACTRPGAGLRQPQPASSSCGHTRHESNGPSSSSTRACTWAI